MTRWRMRLENWWKSLTRSLADPHQVEQLDGLAFAVRRHPAKAWNCSPSWNPTVKTRVQRGEGVLEDHRDVVGRTLRRSSSESFSRSTPR